MGMLDIDRDLGRFRDIVKGKVRRELRGYMSSGELIGRQGGKTVSIPLPQIGIPRLRHGDNDQGVGQGDGFSLRNHRRFRQQVFQGIFQGREVWVGHQI